MPGNQIQQLAVEIKGLKKDVENQHDIHVKLDTAIDKLTEVSASIKSMLAVHQEKLSQAEKTDEILFQKVRERGEELDIIYRDLQRDINQVEKRLLLEIKSLQANLTDRVGVLEKWRWLIVGGALAIGFIVARNMPKILSSTGIFS